MESTTTVTTNNSTAFISEDQVRSANWIGSIPIVLTLAPTSLSSPTIPPPIHVMVSRNTYLHVGLKQAIFRLYKFAPSIINFSSGLVRIEPEPPKDDDEGGDDDKKESNKNDNDNNNKEDDNNKKKERERKEKPINTSESNYPVCWFEDEESHIPLRWHLFVGVLYDITRKETTSTNSSNPQQQLQQQQSQLLPWRIRLHFNNYPSSEILPLESNEVASMIERSFKNSLKQALFLQYSNAKVAQNMTKQTHERLWDSVVNTNYKLYQQINVDLQKKMQKFDINNHQNEKDNNFLLPIKLFLNSRPPIQKPMKPYMIQNNDIADNTSACTETNGKTESATAIPVTLGSLLAQWIPRHFQEQKQEDGSITITNCNVSWMVSGIVPPLSVTLLELWRNLCHPDHFLYVIVLTSS